MKIQTTIKEERTIEKEIELPYFGKDKGYYYKVVDEETVMEIVCDTGFMSVKVVSLWLKKLEVSQSEPITEEEFNTAYSKALAAIDKAFMAPEATLFDGKESEEEINTEAINQ